MLDPKHFREYVVRPTLAYLGVTYASPAAENLVVGTALMESDLTWLQQHGAGPARGLFQIEPRTHEDIYANYFPGNFFLHQRVDALLAPWPTRTEQLRTNLAYATAICRVIYYRSPIQLPPDPDDIAGLASVYKRVYNTVQGAADPADFIRKYRAAFPEVAVA